MYKAILLKDKDSEPLISTISTEDLPSGDVTIQVEYSTINYKDSLALIKKNPIIRKFPMVPGIDLVGKVIESTNPRFICDQKVLLNGWGVGESHWGGYSQIARVNSDWLIPLPSGMSSKTAMAIGTAGYTAMLSLIKLENHGVSPSDGKILVTGSSGGVGSFSIALLTANGFDVVACTGKKNEHHYLKEIGAKEIIDRSDLCSEFKPLDKQNWVGAIDTVGGKILANICATTKADGAIAACGMAQGMGFSTTVAPFILRGITLYGVNSVYVDSSIRIDAWNRLQNELPTKIIESITSEYSLCDVVSIAQKILNGEFKGRCVIDVNN